MVDATTRPTLDDLAGDGFGWWFAGLVAGEGCLTAAVTTQGRQRIALVIKLRDDDAEILEVCRARLGCGTISYEKTQQGKTRGLRGEFRVNRIADCAFVGRVLEHFGCGLPSRKLGEQLPVWVEAAGWLTGPYEVRQGNPGRFAEMIERLREMKAYDPTVAEPYRGKRDVDVEAATVKLWCEAGEHEWELRTRGRRPASCPDHRPLPVQGLWCIAGEHTWTRPSRKGTPPRSCPDHKG